MVETESKLDLDDEEEREVVEGGRLAARVVFEIVRRDGEEELERPTTSLVWSGLAAGIVISFSVVSMAVLRAHLPDAAWRPLIENAGYSVGFLLTILGRLQLFTENTITTIIPLWHCPDLRHALAVLRLWSTVFAANLVGTILAAAFIAFSPAFPPETVEAIREISLHMMENTPTEMFVKGIPAGILIAAIVWVLPSAAGGAFFVIGLFTYLIALAGFTHVVAGATEASFLVLRGEIPPAAALGRFLGPVLAGNVVGGTLVFGLLSYAQVVREFR